jgi:hypothetical protein
MIWALLAGCSSRSSVETNGAPVSSGTAEQIHVAAPPTASSAPIQAHSWANIAFAYHGVLLDTNHRPIPLDASAADELLDSFLGALGEGRKRTLETEAPGLEQLRIQSLQKALAAELGVISTPDRLRLKAEMVRDAVALLPASEQPAYLRRLQAFSAVATPSGLLPDLSSDLRGKLKSFGMDIKETPMPAEPEEETKYMQACRAQGVPIPPPWPGTAWISKGVMPPDFTFASFPNSVSAEVLSSVGEGGLCLALPRFNANKGLEALGIICQSKNTGKACFWDNIDLKTGQRMTGSDVTLKVNSIQGGFELQENCTVCHRGQNAYLVHPNTPLGTVKDRVPLVRYLPIAQAGWTNPKALAEKGTGSCADCHEIAGPSPSYCALVQWAAGKTMPNASSPAGWDTPDDEFKAHIEYLRDNCPLSTE